NRVRAGVRAGFTATCSSADKPRYGHLGVDSNLPDARIALGGPGQNAFTKAVLAAADPAYAEEVERQLADTGGARVWVPAAAPLAAGWGARGGCGAGGSPAATTPPSGGRSRRWPTISSTPRSSSCNRPRRACSTSSRA